MFRRIVMSITIGILAGTATAFFLMALNWATDTRDTHPILIWALPFAGLVIGVVYHYWGKEVASGNNLILEEIHNPNKTLPLSMAPLILGGTVLTHLCGGSAGREGTAVQMGASLSDQLSRCFKMTTTDRRVLLMAGAAAGFSSAIGTPWAGAIFGIEVIAVGKLKLHAWFECLIASFVGYYISVALQAPHSQFSKIEVGDFHFSTLLWIALAGIIFGLAARLFSLLTHAIEKLNERFITYAPLRPFFAGGMLIILYYLEGSYRYVGLGIPVINEALSVGATSEDSIYKMAFTALTVGSGFKGGEFIPLVFIGTTLGSALSLLIPVSFKLLATVGFAAVFAGAANTPLACSLMVIELFGTSIAPYAIAGCYMSYYFSGHMGIYKSQPVFAKRNTNYRIFTSSKIGK